MAATKKPVQRLTNTLRVDIIEKVVCKTYSDRINKVKEELVQFAKDMTAKYHVGFEKGLKDEAIAPYLSQLKGSGTFRYRTAKDRGVETIEFLELFFERKAGTVSVMTTGGRYRHNRIQCVGPKSGSYSSDLFSVTINANENRRLQAIERRQKEIQDAVPQFVANLKSTLYSVTTVEALLKAFPELEKIVDFPEVTKAAKQGAIVPVTDLMKKELKAAGLPPKDADNDENFDNKEAEKNVIAL